VQIRCTLFCWYFGSSSTRPLFTVHSGQLVLMTQNEPVTSQYAIEWFHRLAWWKLNFIPVSVCLREAVAWWDSQRVHMGHIQVEYSYYKILMLNTSYCLRGLWCESHNIWGGDPTFVYEYLYWQILHKVVVVVVVVVVLYLQFILCLCLIKGRDISVGVVTRYGQDDSGIESRGGGGWEFSNWSRPPLGLT
jgi:hypothetical protein